MSSLDQLQEFRAVRIRLPLKDKPPLPLDCVAKVENAPFLLAVFLPDQLPSAEELVEEGECLISFEIEGTAHSLRARIDALVDSDRLRLEASQPKVRQQERQHFRVDVDLNLRYRRLDGPEPVPKKLQGTVNVSGGGLWFPVQEEMEAGERLTVELYLPGSPPQRVFAVAEVIRMTGEGSTRGVAVKFVEIEEEDQDEIIAYCFAEQRRQLRKRVHIEDQL